MRACVYRAPGSCSDALLTKFSISLSTCPQLVPHFVCVMISIFILIKPLVIVLISELSRVMQYYSARGHTNIPSYTNS